MLAVSAVLRLVGLLIGVTGIALVIAVGDPSGVPAQAIAQLLPVSAVHAANAERALESAPGVKGGAQALPASNRELAVSPSRVFPPLRRAVIVSRLQMGRLGVVGTGLLARSYTLSRYDVAYGVWRCLFAFEHWDELTPAIRSEVADEFSILYSTNARDEFRAAAGKVSNRSGRFAINLLIQKEMAHPSPNVLERGEMIRAGKIVLPQGATR